MERLIYSSPLSAKTPLNSYPFLPRIGRTDAGKLGFSPFSSTKFRRVDSFFCKQEDPPASSSSLFSSEKFLVRSSIKASSSPIDSPVRVTPTSPSLKQIVEGAFLQEKVCVIFFCTLFLLKKKKNCFLGWVLRFLFIGRFQTNP